VRSTKLRGIGLDEACTMALSDLVEWASGIAATMPDELVAMARQIVDELTITARRLLDLGLGYLSLDRASSTLSTGERQRVQLARAVRNRTTGVLYVLDEPSIGLHPANLDGLTGLVRDLLADGNSVLVVDHDVALLREADWLVEIGPGSGREAALRDRSGIRAIGLPAWNPSPHQKQRNPSSVQRNAAARSRRRSPQIRPGSDC